MFTAAALLWFTVDSAPGALFTSLKLSYKAVCTMMKFMLVEANHC